MTKLPRARAAALLRAVSDSWMGVPCNTDSSCSCSGPLQYYTHQERSLSSFMKPQSAQSPVQASVHGVLTIFATSAMGDGHGRA